MAKEIDPKSTTRAKAFEFWMQAPNPMVTFFKSLNVTRLVKVSKKRGLKFNMLMDYCIGKAAASVKEFYMLPVNGKLMQYDSIAVNTIVENDEGEISSCDIPYSEDLATFNRDYLKYTNIDTEIDGAVGMNSGIFNNPFMIWGRYRKRLFRYELPASFQFHHTQMDGAHAGKFLANLQKAIDELR